MLSTSASSVVAGVLADGIGPRATVLLMGTLALAWGGFWTLWTRRLWTAGVEPAPEPQPAGRTVE
jgi:hypothetical protein